MYRLLYIIFFKYNNFVFNLLLLSHKLKKRQARMQKINKNNSFRKLKK